MRTTRIAAVPAAALLAVSALSACGSDDKATDAAKSAGSSVTNAAGSAGASATSGASGAASSATGNSSSAASDSSSSASSSSSTSCPTGDNTKSFAKTRFTADVGLAAGTFKHWIYDPYKKGSFDKNRNGGIDKTDAIKAAATAVADYKLLSNALDNAKANPTLCKTVAGPISDAMGKLKNVNKGDIAKGALTGNVGSLVTAAGALGSIEQLVKGSNDSGNKITENTDISKSDMFDGAAKKLLGN